MRLRELVDILVIKKLAPIHFFEGNSVNIYTECKHMTDEELNDYLNQCLTKGKEYNMEELGIYIPDVTIDELYEMEDKLNPANLKKVLDDISYIFLVKHDERRIIFATYVILHEVGHWINFKKSNMTSLEYSLWDSEYRRESSKYSAEVRNIPDFHPMKYIYAQKAVDMYKNIPSEKAADEYAFQNIEKSLKLLGMSTIKLNEFFKR